MLGSHQEANDAVQDIFLRINKGLCNFREESKISTWIYKIATNVCLRQCKKKKHLFNSIDEEYIQKLISEQHSHPPVDTVYEKKELHKVVLRCISKLPPKYRVVILLYYYEELSYEEIADIVDIPVGTVGTNLHLAKNALRTIMKKEL